MVHFLWKIVQHETMVDVNGKNKRKNPMVSIVQSSSRDLSQGSLRNRNNEIIIHVQQYFIVLPHLSETYHNKINHVVD